MLQLPNSLFYAHHCILFILLITLFSSSKPFRTPIVTEQKLLCSTTKAFNKEDPAPTFSVYSHEGRLHPSQSEFVKYILIFVICVFADFDLTLSSALSYYF